MKTWRDYLENILIAVFLALVVRTFVISGYKVPTSSMAPTLLPGDFIFAFRLPFGLKVPLTDKKIAINSPQRGEVVVFSYLDQPKVSYVKRVVGLPGDRVQIQDGQLLINEQKLSYRDVQDGLLPSSLNPELFKLVEERDSDQVRHLVVAKETQKKSKSYQFGPFVVPPNEIFLLGDNRDSSDDSRYWGTVPIERVDGRVVWIWLSLNWQKMIWDNRMPTVRWERTWRSLSSALD